MRINKDTKLKRHAYFPKDKDELQNIINDIINEEGPDADLNCIDTSKITDMSNLFENMNYFSGDVSEWYVSNVTNMNSMFYDCMSFNSDISRWDISHVKYMSYMFHGCEIFNQDISGWDISKVENVRYMFAYCVNFNQDLSNWDIKHIDIRYTRGMLHCCGINFNNMPKYYRR